MKNEQSTVDPITEAIGIRIVMAREAAGWSRDNLAAMAFKSKAALRMQEAGLALPSIHDIMTYAEILGVDPAVLAFGGPMIVPTVPLAPSGTD